jgi:transcriptional regulator with XRE-family HTH domain
MRVNTLTKAACKVSDMPKVPFNQRAKNARERVGLSPEKAADLIGCARTTVIRWEKDASSIASEYLVKAALAYKVRPDWLTMDGDTDHYPWEGFASHAARFDDSTMQAALDFIYLIAEARPDDNRFSRITWLMVNVAAKVVAKKGMDRREAVREFLSSIEAKQHV